MPRQNYLGEASPPPPVGAANPALRYIGSVPASAASRRVTTFGTSLADVLSQAPFPPSPNPLGNSATWLTTSGAGLLAAVRAMLVASGVAPASAVFVSLDPEPQPGGELPYLVVRPGPFRRDMGAFAGSGRALARFDGSITISVVGRNSTDMRAQDTLRLTAPHTADVPNLYTLASLAQDPVDGQFAVDEAGNNLSLEPMCAASIAGPRIYGQGAERRSWVAIDVEVQLAYAEDRSNKFA